MHDFKFPTSQSYKIENIDKINTPALLIFKESVFENLKLMKSYLEKISPGSGFRHLCPHVKTHKSSFITQLMLDAGIKKFKCTPNETDMLVNSGAKDIFIAYPLLEKNAAKIAEKIEKYPLINFQVQIGLLDHAEILHKISTGKNITWNYYIDIDVGMHRTGAMSKDVLDLYKKICKFKNFNFVGLHGYDGHNHHKDKKHHVETSQKSMLILLDLYEQFSKKNINVSRIMAAGSPAFRTDFEILHKALNNEVEILVSPGTWIYWDSQYDSILPGEFEFAALILAQVVDVDKNQITLNLGHKRWAADQGEIQIFSEPGLKIESFSEEHTVLLKDTNSKYLVGDYILIVPRHVCPTVNLYENFTLIGEDGTIEELSVPVDARNR